MAEIYIIDTSKCKNEILALTDRVSKKRQETVLKLKNEGAVIQKLASEIILAYSLGQELPITYKTQKNGKPYIPTLPFFNISHSGNFVVCAVSNKEVGVDIEEISRMKISLARKILSAKEEVLHQAVSGAKLQYLLCEKWVRKEAYLKMLGIGLKKDPTSLSFDGDTLIGEEIFSRVYPIGTTHLLSFCRSEDVPVSIIEVSPNELIEYFKIEIQGE